MLYSMCMGSVPALLLMDITLFVSLIVTLACPISHRSALVC